MTYFLAKYFNWIQIINVQNVLIEKKNQYSMWNIYTFNFNFEYTRTKNKLYF